MSTAPPRRQHTTSGVRRHWKSVRSPNGATSAVDEHAPLPRGRPSCCARARDKAAARLRRDTVELLAAAGGASRRAAGRTGPGDTTAAGRAEAGAWSRPRGRLGGGAPSASAAPAREIPSLVSSSLSGSQCALREQHGSSSASAHIKQGRRLTVVCALPTASSRWTLLFIAVWPSLEMTVRAHKIDPQLPEPVSAAARQHGSKQVGHQPYQLSITGSCP